MTAEPPLTSIILALNASHLEAVLIGNAAAAIHGAQSPPWIFDFLLNGNTASVAKLKKFDRLGCGDPAAVIPCFKLLPRDE